jgi:hypothetical protein
LVRIRYHDGMLGFTWFRNGVDCVADYLFLSHCKKCQLAFSGHQFVYSLLGFQLVRKAQAERLSGQAFDKAHQKSPVTRSYWSYMCKGTVSQHDIGLELFYARLPWFWPRMFIR